MPQLSEKFKELYPEHTKFEAAKENGHDQIEAFLNWIEEQPDLALYAGPNEGSPYPEDWSYMPNLEEYVIARYYGIDRDAFSKEKDVMLENIREYGNLEGQ